MARVISKPGQLGLISDGDIAYVIVFDHHVMIGCRC